MMASKRQMSGLGYAGYVDWICVHFRYVGLVWSTQDQHTIAVYGTVESRMVSSMVSFPIYCCGR